MKNIISLTITIIISFSMMSQDKLIQIDKSSYYKDSKNVYFVITNYLSNAPFFFPSTSRSEIPLATIKNNGKLVDLGPFNELGIIITREEFEKKYRMSADGTYHQITSRFDTHSTFAIKLPNVTIESLKNFKLLDKDYASIGDKIFLRYDELKGVDTVTFQLIHPGYNFFYSKDKNSAFYYDHKIIGVDILSFEVRNRLLSYDKNLPFIKGAVLDNLDVKSFRMRGNYQRDANHIWFEGSLLDGIDIKTVEFLIKSHRHLADYSDYIIDKNSVFYQGNRMLKADPKSFKVIITSFFRGPLKSYAIDNTHVYSDGKIIKDADPKTFKVILTEKGMKILNNK